MSADTIRVPSPHPIPTGENLPEGFRLVWEEKDRDDWYYPISEADADVRPCRGAKKCPGRPVAALERKPGQFWFYCQQHLYGRRIEDGKLMVWRWVEDASPARD